MRVALEKLPGVDSARVSLNDGYAEIAFAPGNTLTVTQLREAIRKNGFTPRDARATVRGRIVAGDGGGLILEAPGAGRFALGAERGALERVRPLAAEGGVTALEGTVPENEPGTLRLDRLP